MIEKNSDQTRGILLRRYPAFVLSDHVDDLGSIPAFVFHGVTAELLEPMLEFLAENKYATLTADEYLERNLQPQRAQEREVLLTFDDGLKSLYKAAYPALRRLGLKAVAYIVPGMILEAGEAQDSPLCNWNEIKEMHASGVLDFQSHSMYHHSVAVSNRVADFVRPGINLSFLDSDLAPLFRQNGRIRKCNEPPYGTPLYHWWSRYGPFPEYQEKPVVAQTCVEFVDQHGGIEFFRERGWRNRLVRLVEASRRGNAIGRFETAAEQRAAILKDFLDSKREIEGRLAGKVVRHFAYPWFRGSPLSAQLSVEAGYVSNAWTGLIPSFASAREPIPIARLAPAFLWRLPGKRRKPLSKVLRSRISEILQSRRWSEQKA
jgi:hypothetical protein